MNLYVLSGILLAIIFILWRVYRAGAKSKQTQIERDTLEANLGVEHAIREELIELKEKQKKELDVILNDPESARNLWLRDNSTSSDSRDT